MTTSNSNAEWILGQRVMDAATEIFGDLPIAQQIHSVCSEYARQYRDIQSDRGIDKLTLAIVGAKGQGKTWLARQFVKDEAVRKQLRSGDLSADATTRLTWVGPFTPEGLTKSAEDYYFCNSETMADLGIAYMLIDTPGLTDADRNAAEVARKALALAPIKLLVIARDQIRSAVNTQIARLVSGSVCLPVITAIDPRELDDPSHHNKLKDDLRNLVTHLEQSAPRSRWLSPVLIADFDARDGELKIGQLAMQEIISRIKEQPLDELAMARSRVQRLSAMQDRFRHEVGSIIQENAPHLSTAVRRLHEEVDKLPEEAVLSMLGTQSILQAGVRTRLRAQLVNDTNPLWFPYRSVMSTLHLTQGAWDRLLLSLTGSVPSIFGTLVTWARNVQQTRQLQWELHDGLRDRMRLQIQDRLQPLCDQFYRAISTMRGSGERREGVTPSANVQLLGVEELQVRSREIFESSLSKNSVSSFLLQLFGLLGTVLFWIFMAGPFVSLYQQYFHASYEVMMTSTGEIEKFPHPSPSLFLTAFLLSVLPLLVYCMIVLTLLLPKSRIKRVAQEIHLRHNQEIESLRSSGILQMQFENRLLAQAHFLMQIADRRGQMPS